MIATRAVQRRVRLLFAGGFFAGGFVLAMLLVHQGDFPITLGSLSVILAALVGTGKLASP